MSFLSRIITDKQKKTTKSKDNARDASLSTSIFTTAPASFVDSKSTASVVGVGSVKYIIKPLITEQGTLLAENNTYLFQVALRANKRAIRAAIEKIYGVKVIGVRTARYLGKKVRYGRVAGQRSDFKKAFVTVAKGQTIVVNKNV